MNKDQDLETKKRIEALETDVLGRLGVPADEREKRRQESADALLSQAMRDWNPDRIRSLSLLKFLIDNYAYSDMADPPKEGFSEELQQTIFMLAQSDQQSIAIMLSQLNGKRPAKFGKQMLEKLGVPESVNLQEIYLGGLIRPPEKDSPAKG